MARLSRFFIYQVRAPLGGRNARPGLSERFGVVKFCAYACRGQGPERADRLVAPIYLMLLEGPRLATGTGFRTNPGRPGYSHRALPSAQGGPMRSLASAWRSVRKRFPRINGRLLLCFDFDGTLAPFVPSPGRARIGSDGRRLLQDLSAHPRVCLAIVSSRGLADLQARAGLPGIALAGSNGLEYRVNGMTFEAPVPARLDPG